MKAEMYNCRAMRGNENPGTDDDPNIIHNPTPYDIWTSDNVIDLTILAHGHRQHIWSSTTLIGVSALGQRKLGALRDAGYDLYVTVGGRCIRIDGCED